VYTCIGPDCQANSPLPSTLPTSSTLFATTNASITAAILGTNGPAMPITSITRGISGGAPIATVTLASAPSPALVAGQSVTIAGSQYREFNGSFSITPLTATTFTYPITIDPPNPATGAYSATVPSNPKAISLARSGTTVTATSAAAHGYVTGQTVTIAGAAGSRYNGSYPVTGTPTLNTFTYTISDGPATPDGGGTAKVGATFYTIPSGGIVRSPSNALNISNVTVTFPSTITFAAGNSVTIGGAGTGGVSSYNGTWTITNTGTSCPGGAKSGNKPLSFCFNINTTPASPDPATSITTDGGTSPLAITAGGLSYTVGACSATAYSTVLVTAFTGTVKPAFATGETFSIGGTVAANESPYVGNFKVVSVNTTSAPYSFTYNIATSPGTASTCTDATSGMSASAQGVSRDSLINWVRGYDNVGDEASPGGGITIRPSVHGDVLHSRPAVLNYGGSTGVVVFYGSNDGMFRAVNGNQPPASNAAPAPMGGCTVSSTCAIGSVPPGGELWSFVPQEFYPKLQRLYNNSPLVKLATTPTGITPTPQPKDYFFDASPSVYQNGGTAYVFLSARRGGRLLYALDVSDPANPKFMWKHTSADPGFAEFGQTWSQPKVAMIKGNANPVLIFGAGYDTNEDAEPPVAESMGRGIFILDAVTGHMLWQAIAPGATCAGGSVACVKPAGMNYAIPADITFVDRNYDGKIDRLYAADTGGNIWRVDLEPTSTGAPATWQVTQFAALGGTGTTKRKFFFSPDVVFTKTYDVVLGVTGDREHPLATQQANNIVNRFYMLKDTNVGMSAAGWTTIHDDTSSTADTQPPALFKATSTTPYDGTLKGFYLTLPGLSKTGVPSLGEKGVNAPLMVGGYVYFGTNQPTPPSTTSCSANLGIARSYAVNFLTGASSFNVLDGGGLAPSPVSGIVNVTVNGVNRRLPFLLGGGGGGGGGADARSGLGAQKPSIPIKIKRKRTYWYRESDR
ncbi:MAG: PilC/PilY family type IV pilus protein, partial [Polaromonas sp.]